MDIHLTDDLADFVRRSIASGRHASANDVIRDALRLLAETDLCEQIAVGLRSSRSGPLVDGDVVFARLEAHLRQLEDRQPGE